jgi:uncharacterized lipoprotein YmbA
MVDATHLRNAELRELYLSGLRLAGAAYRRAWDALTGERLSVGATRALTSDLQERLSGVLVTNTAPLDRPALQVIAELETFEPQADGTVILVARWRLVNTASHRVLASERVSLTESNSGATDSAMAAGCTPACGGRV